MRKMGKSFAYKVFNSFDYKYNGFPRNCSRVLLCQKVGKSEGEGRGGLFVCISADAKIECSFLTEVARTTLLNWPHRLLQREEELFTVGVGNIAV